MKLDVEEILQKAEGICVQIRTCKVLPVCLFPGSVQPRVVAFICRSTARLKEPTDVLFQDRYSNDQENQEDIMSHKNTLLTVGANLRTAERSN